MHHHQCRLFDWRLVVEDESSNADLLIVGAVGEPDVLLRDEVFWDLRE